MASMEYDGYVGVVEVDDEADILHGQIVNTRDVITFQGRTVKELRRALRESVEDYLAFCKDRGEEPERPYSGKFMVRVDPTVHRDLAITAASEGKSIQTVVREAIQARVMNGASECSEPISVFSLSIARHDRAESEPEKKFVSKVARGNSPRAGKRRA